MRQQGLRVVSWNMRRATANAASWDYLASLDPDIALLQEVSSVPASMESRYAVVHRKARGRRGQPQRFGTAILARGDFRDEVELRSDIPWLDEQLPKFRGNLVAAEISCGLPNSLKVMSVYSPAWPLDRSSYEGLDVSDFKLKHNRDVWATELLWGFLRTQDLAAESWIVGGDLNSSESFDYMWPGGPHGNREVLDRLADLGLTECLRKTHGEAVPTFRNPCGGKRLHQIDHMFVTGALLAKVRSCNVGDESRVFGNGLSDHLPIVLDLDVGQQRRVEQGC